MENAVRVVGTPTVSAEPTNRIVCRVCQKQYANYTCPRCNTRYCSLPCYKGHSNRCNESFMRDNVLTEMKSLGVSSESKRKMLEALKRQHEAEVEESGLMNEDADDAQETVLSEETLHKIATKGELSTSDLRPEELRAFQRAVAAGELSHLIKPWEPWWLKPAAQRISLTSQGNKLVKLVTDVADSNDSTSRGDFPLPPTDPLPSLSQLTKAEPSPSLPVHLVEVLCTYCFVLRLYNGEWQESPLESALDVMAVSKVLSQASVPSTLSEAVGSCLEAICSPSFKHAGGYNLGLGLCDDVACILRIGKGPVICSLTDLRRLLDAGSREAKKPRALQAASRKVFFLLVWANEVGSDVLKSFAALVDAEKQKLIGMRSTVEPRRSSGSGSGSRNIIEEL